jgi:nucleoid-associated protein YgaU
VVVVVPEPGAVAAARGAAPGATPGTTASPSAAAAPPASAASMPEPAPIAVLIPAAAQGAPPRILQGPQPSPPQGMSGGAGRGGASARLGMDSVDYREGGGIRFAGTAPPGAAVRVYVGEDHAGDATADAAGRWMLAPERQPPVGRHALRVDQIAAGGAVAARVEVPFQRDEVPPEAFDSRAVVVQPGANLWRIARSTYGQGVHYTVIYQANREQIRDPNRIFPGQIFALPEGASAPSASSVSR